VTSSIFKDQYPPVPYEWFHGQQDRKTAQEKMNKSNVAGAFLVRMSDRHPSSFVVSYSKMKEEKLCFKSVIITNGKSGYTLHGKTTGFATLAALIDDQRSEKRFTTPLKSDLYARARVKAQRLTGVSGRKSQTGATGGGSVYAKFTGKPTEEGAKEGAKEKNVMYSTWDGGPTTTGDEDEIDVTHGSKYTRFQPAPGDKDDGDDFSKESTGAYSTFPAKKS